MKTILNNRLVELFPLNASSRRGNTWKREMESRFNVFNDHDLFVTKMNGKLFAIQDVSPISDDPIVSQNMYNDNVTRIVRKIDNMMWQMDHNIVTN